MNIDAGIALAVGVVVFAAVLIAAWVLVRRRLPPDVAEEIAAVLAAVQAVVGEAVDEEFVRSMAGWAYDVLVTSASEYYSKDQFIELVLRVLRRGPAMRGTLRPRAEAYRDSAARARGPRINGQ